RNQHHNTVAVTSLFQTPRIFRRAKIVTRVRISARRVPSCFLLFQAELRLFEVNCFSRHATETTRQTELRQSPDQPVGGGTLPRFHAVAVILLKFVVIIMIALAES